MLLTPYLLLFYTLALLQYTSANVAQSAQDLVLATASLNG